MLLRSVIDGRWGDRCSCWSGCHGPTWRQGRRNITQSDKVTRWHDSTT